MQVLLHQGSRITQKEHQGWCWFFSYESLLDMHFTLRMRPARMVVIFRNQLPDLAIGLDLSVLCWWLYLNFLVNMNWIFLPASPYGSASVAPKGVLQQGTFLASAVLNHSWINKIAPCVWMRKRAALHRCLMLLCCSFMCENSQRFSTCQKVPIFHF